MTLLHNKGGVLPLSASRIKTLALVGPNADATKTMQAHTRAAVRGGGPRRAHRVCAGKLLRASAISDIASDGADKIHDCKLCPGAHSVWLLRRCRRTNAQWQGCDIATNSTAGIPAAAAAAAAADATVIVIGMDQSVESEGHDRTSLLLPGAQAALVRDVASAGAGKPVVVVVRALAWCGRLRRVG